MRKLLFVLFLITLVVPIFAQEIKERRVFMCSNCQQIIAMDKRPNSLGCSKSNYHIWAELGREGGIAFICKKCNKIIYTKMRPNSAYTKEHGYHVWHKIGELGEKIFSCKKCGATAHLKQRPSGSICPSADGGYHQWYVH